MDSGTADLVAPVIHVGRQPIYDLAGDVVAYEMLFRDAVDATRSTRRSAEATAHVIVATFTEFGLDQLVGGRACFINVTKEFLTGELPVPFDPQQSVLEIVETVEVDDAVIDGVRRLEQRGFTIALDDFAVDAHEQLLEFATYVKIDLLDSDPRVTAEAIQRCHAYPHVQLIAERLESEADLQRAIDLGFSLFQGHVLGHPHVLSTAALSPGHLSRMQLLVALTAAEVDFEEVVELITNDPALSYRLLLATNAAASGLRDRVSSVRQAAALLGVAKVQDWVTLMAVGDLAGATAEQLALIMSRAHGCRIIASQAGRSTDAAFTIGLLSGVADLTARSREQLAAQLPLSMDVAEALAHGAGPLGEVLEMVIQYEQGRPASLATLVGQDAAAKAHLSALGWATNLVGGLHPAASGWPLPPVLQAGGSG